MPTILFRTDSSSSIGTGHVMRDLVLAEKFKEVDIVFATEDLQGNINNKIREKNYKLEILSSNDLKELIDIIKKYSIDMIIIDHYSIGYNFEKRLKEITGITIFRLDDTYEKHYCDILLNHNIYAESLRYKNLVPEHCEIRCGGKYTLLRDEFVEARKVKGALKDKSAITVFIAMGGSDIANLNPKILKVLEKFENIQVNMVTTTANQNLKELQQFIEDKPWVNLHINSKNIANLMGKSDLAIVTPSVTMNEVWYMQIPFIAIKVADNQKYMYEYLKEKNKLVLEKFDPIILNECIQRLLKDKES